MHILSSICLFSNTFFGVLFTFFSGENPVKICSELWHTMGCCGVCAPINGIKKAIPEVLSRFRSWFSLESVGSTPITRILLPVRTYSSFHCFVSPFFLRLWRKSGEKIVSLVSYILFFRNICKVISPAVSSNIDRRQDRPGLYLES